MTIEVFFWYVLPFLIGAGALGWMVYDSRRARQNPHPGE